jgi:hypothetical protein
MNPDKAFADYDNSNRALNAALDLLLNEHFRAVTDADPQVVLAYNTLVDLLNKRAANTMRAWTDS